MMMCPKCGTEMVWGSDDDLSDEDSVANVSSNLACHNCNTIVVIYWGEEDET